MPSFRFQTVARSLADFQEMFHHHQHSGDSPFTRRDVCSMATPAGRVTVSGGQLIETSGGARQVTELGSDAARSAALERCFDLRL